MLPYSKNTMYSKIIQLSEQRLSKPEHITIFDLTEDQCLKAHSDYAGSEYQYDDVIDEIATELRPVAFINKTRHTLTFKKQTSVERKYLRNLLQVYRDTKKGLFPSIPLIGTASPGYHSHHAVNAGVETVGVSDYLFSYGPDNACHTLSELLFDYLNGNLPRTLRIGAILDYHY